MGTVVIPQNFVFALRCEAAEGETKFMRNDNCASILTRDGN